MADHFAKIKKTVNKLDFDRDGDIDRDDFRTTKGKIVIGGLAFVLVVILYFVLA